MIALIFLGVILILFIMGIADAFTCSTIGGIFSIISCVAGFTLYGVSSESTQTNGTKITIVVSSICGMICPWIAAISSFVHLDEHENDVTGYGFMILIFALLGVLIYSFTKIGELSSIISEFGEKTEKKIAERVATKSKERLRKIAFLRRNDSTYKEATNESMEIGAYQYAGRSNLHTIRIASSCKSIGEWAFQNCSSLQRIEFSGSINDWKRMKKHPTWDYDTPDYLVVCKDGTIKKSEQ